MLRSASPLTFRPAIVQSAGLALVVSVCLVFALAASAAGAAPGPGGPLVGSSSLGVLPAPDPGPATPELIAKALDAGRIDLARATELRVDALRGESLPEAYQSETPWEGTLVLLEVERALPELSAAERREVEYYPTMAAATETAAAPRSSACGPNSGQLDNQLETAHYLIEYGNLPGELTIEDYATALEHAWAKEVVEFGWDAPPTHAAANGLYNVRIVDLNPGGVQEGQTVTTGYVSDSGTYASGGRQSCMVINTRVNEFVDPRGTMSSTVAHELAHSLQFGMGAISQLSGSFIEGGAEWMAQEVYDANQSGLGKLFPDVQDPLAQMGETDGAFGPYRAWYALRGLTERFGSGVAGGGEQVMEDLYEAVGAGTSGQMAALRQALSNQGVNLADAYADFAIGAKFGLTCEDAGLRRSSGRCLAKADIYGHPQRPGPAGFAHGHLQLASFNGYKVSGGIKNDYATKWIKLKGDTTTYAVTMLNKATNGEGRIRATVACVTAGGLADLTSIAALLAGESGSAFVDPRACVGDAFLVMTSEDSSGGTVLDFEVSTGSASTQTLTIAKNGGGAGLVTSKPGGVDCGARCSARYLAGAAVVLHAAPTAATSGFAGWSGCASVTQAGDCTVTMSAARSVTATFSDQTDHTLTTTLVSPDGASPGTVATVTPEDPSFACSASSCTQRYRAGVAVRLSADAGNGYALGGWSGCASVQAGECLTTMGADRGVTATFVSAPKVVPAKTLVSTVAGYFDRATGRSNRGDNIPAIEAYLQKPREMLEAPNGDWFVTDSSSIRRFTIGGLITTVAGVRFGVSSGSEPPVEDGDQATSGSLRTPGGLALDSDGSLVFIELTAMRIRRVDLTTGVISTVIETDPHGLPYDLAMLPGGGFVYTDMVTGLFKVDADGKRTALGSGDALHVTVRDDGHMFVTTKNDVLYRVSPSGERTRIMKLPQGCDNRCGSVTDLSILPDGSLLTTWVRGTVLRIVGKNVYTIAGVPDAQFADDGGRPADESEMVPHASYPFAGGILVTQPDNGDVRLIDKTSITQPPASPSASTSVSIPFETLQLGSTVSAECALDSGGYKPCSSPFTATGLANGEHTLRVRATDALGTDPTPSTATWNVGAASGAGAGRTPTGTTPTGTTPTGTTPTGRTPTGRTPTPAVDTKGPLTSVGTPRKLALGKALKRGVPVTVVCSEVCRIVADLRLAKKQAKKLRIPALVAKARGLVSRVSASGKRTLTMKFTKKAKKKLKRMKKVKLTLFVTTTDARGNKTQSKRAVTIKR